MKKTKFKNLIYSTNGIGEEAGNGKIPVNVPFVNSMFKYFGKDEK